MEKNEFKFLHSEMTYEADTVNCLPKSISLTCPILLHSRVSFCSSVHHPCGRVLKQVWAPINTQKMTLDWPNDHGCLN